MTIIFVYCFRTMYYLFSFSLRIKTSSLLFNYFRVLLSADVVCMINVSVIDIERVDRQYVILTLHS